MHCIFTSLMNTFGVKNIEKWSEQVTKHRHCEKVTILLILSLESCRLQILKALLCFIRVQSGL